MSRWIARTCGESNHRRIIGLVTTLPVGHVGHLGRHGDGAGHDQVVVVLLEPLLRRAL